MEDKICWLSVAFGDQRYLDQIDRLEQSIKAIYPDANIMFWRDELPKNSKPFLESLYGFKVHAIQEAIDAGYKHVIWLDPAMILLDKIDPILKHWLVAVKDDHKLHNVVSNAACKFFGFTHTIIEALDMHLIGGSLYYFNFNDMRVRSIFELWKRAEEAGVFGSQAEAASEQLQGHRYDETCLALAMYGHKLYPQWGPEVGYCVEKDGIFTKRHFK